MLNKKGTTLAEVIISIALISVVLVFMIRLLIDLNNMETNTNFASANQMTRAEIIRMIGNDLNDLELTQVIDTSTENNLSITFNFSNGTFLFQKIINLFICRKHLPISLNFKNLRSQIFHHKNIVNINNKNYISI